jgi:Ras-related protein Rab-18
VRRYATIEDAVKMVVANKTDLTVQRAVTAQEGHDFARRHGCVTGCARMWLGVGVIECARVHE